MKVAKKSGGKEPFDEGKLWNSVYYPAREAHYDEERAVDLADETKNRVLEWTEEHEDTVLTAEELREKIVQILEDVDEDVAFMYSTHLDLS